jgi:hypothetical protein
MVLMHYPIRITRTNPITTRGSISNAMGGLKGDRNTPRERVEKSGETC